MKDFLNLKSVKVLIAVLAILTVISILGAMGNPWVSSAFNFLTKGLSSVTSNLTEGQKSYDELKAENEKLKSETADLRSQLVDYYDIKSENARLWKYYQLKKTNPDYELMPASVIRRDTNEEFYAFTIDAGSSTGISVLDPVLTENGVIGFVSSVNASSSKVTTILSPDFQAGAVDKKTNDFNSSISFDSRMYAEDIDVTRRLHEKYKTLYYPLIPVYHKFSRASHSSFRLFWIHVSNIIMYFNKWGWWKDSFRKEANKRLEEQIADGGIKDDDIPQKRITNYKLRITKSV